MMAPGGVSASSSCLPALNASLPLGTGSATARPRQHVPARLARRAEAGLDVWEQMSVSPGLADIRPRKDQLPHSTEVTGGQGPPVATEF